MKLRYVEGSTAATVMTLFSIGTWASERVSTLCTPLSPRIAATVDGLSESPL
ncbi:hypothetical protein [Nocardioides ungokensis]|uniref:hypothetical protein n=1 Tax=Nocardioides ungokensis TaxID=1643322 RepID=UPI001FEB2AD7|nr:hypothetical protein [Nocardioides ungokensis]